MVFFLWLGRNTGDNVRFGMAHNSPKHHCRRPDRPVWLDQKRSGISNFDRGFPVSCQKRDGTCYFDQLALPAHLRRLFGRPPVIAGDFARGVFDSIQTLKSFHMH